MIIVSAQKLSDFQKLIREYSEMIKIDFIEEMATCKLIDTSNVTFCTIDLLPGWFKTYEPSVSEFYISMTDISKILAVCDKESTVMFNVGTGNEKGLLNVVCNTPKFAYSISLRVFDKSVTAMKTPTEEFYKKMESLWNVYNINGGDFVDVCKGISAIYSGDALKDSTVNIKISGDTATFTTEDLDKNKMSCDMIMNINKKVTETDISGMYSLHFIDIFIKPGLKMANDNDDPTVSMFVGNNVPIRFVYSLHEGNCIVDTVLAPRIVEK